MKDQNKNQKAPETKLTDAQLSEVNAGLAATCQRMANADRMQLANTQACATTVLANEANIHGYVKEVKRR